MRQEVPVFVRFQVWLFAFAEMEQSPLYTEEILPFR